MTEIVLEENRGEGWPADAPKGIVGRVVGELRPASTVRLTFRRPLELQERGLRTPSGLRLVRYAGAWIRPRHVGFEVREEEPTDVHVWLVESGVEDVPPSGSPRFWAMATIVQRRPGGWGLVVTH